MTFSLRRQALVFAFAFAAWCQICSAQDGDETPAAPMTITVGAGVVRNPDYEGGRQQRLNFFPIANLAYKTDVGVLTLGGDASAPSNSTPLIAWTVAKPDRYSASLLIDYDGGRRDDRRGTALRSGSPHLQGLGNLGGTLEYGASGSYTVGFATANLTARTAPSRQGHGGTILDFSVDLAMPIDDRLTITASPSATWVSSRYMRRYFGVTPAQSAASGFSTYAPDGGVKSYGLTVSANFQATKHWIVAGNLAASRLSGQAGSSPIVERRNSLSPSVGVAYSW